MKTITVFRDVDLCQDKAVHVWGVIGLLFFAAPESFDRLYQQGLRALSENHLGAAQASLEQASRVNPADARVWLALAQTYWKSGKQQPARTAARKAESRGKNQPVVVHGLALFYTESGEPGKAAEFEECYAALAPQQRDAVVRAVDLYLEAKQPKRAIQLARSALSAENRADLRNRLGKAYEADGQPEQSVEQFEEALRLNPYEETYYFDFGQMLLEHQDFARAVPVLEQARKAFDKSAQIELALGVAYYGQRRFDDAADAFLRTIALAPQVQQPYVFLGRMLDQASARLPQIEASFAAYARDYPRDYMGHFLYAKALAAQGDHPDRAEQSLRRSLALEDRYWESHYELALLLEKKRAWAEAAEQLERSIALNPQNPAPHYRLARVYDRMGKSAEAEAERALHEKLAAEEKAAADRRAASVKPLGVK